MKYAQGSFITVPSREVLRGLPPIAQVLYMWLCAYANETGNCYPSRNRLANDCGCSDDSIDKMLALLIEKGLVLKHSRTKEGEKLSNLYTVLIEGGSRSQRVPYPLTTAGVAAENGINSIHRTQSIEVGEQALKRTYSKDTDELEKTVRVIPYPYSVEATRAEWLDGSVRLQILNWYFGEAGLWKIATTSAKLKALMRRHSKAAERLEKDGWTFGEIKKARAKFAENDSLNGEWTLETVEKYLTK